jgi:hypothetical protein
MRKAILTALAAVLVALGGIAAAIADPGNGHGPPATVPGSPSDDCSHGNSDKPCKPDPQPEHGKDCDDHGVARGNEDHCGPTTPTETTPTETTPTDTTPTDTTPTDTTPTDTTPTDTTPTDTTPTTPEVTTSTPNEPTVPDSPTPRPTKKSKPKPDRPHSTKIVHVQPKPNGVVVVTTADGRKHTAIMGSG